jgi:acyl-CoA reductase-like NAD-dependent aldehyde dehydrogenase
MSAMRNNYIGGAWTSSASDSGIDVVNPATDAVPIARRLRAGQVEVNGGAWNVAAPFGGFGQSGYGRELGAHGLEEYLEIKALQF